MGDSATGHRVEPPRHVLGIGFLLFVVLGAFFFSTAPRDSWTADPLTNMASAWKLGTSGTPWLPEYEGFLDTEPIAVINVVTGTQGAISQYPPGTALVAAPIYALADDRPVAHVDIEILDGEELSVPPIWPGALTAAVTTSGAIAILLRLLATLWDRQKALISVLVMALGTGAWSVSSQALWQHGPAMFWIAVAMYATAHPGGRLRNLAWVPAILTRPHTLLIGAVSSVYRTLQVKDPRLLWPLVGVAVGVVLLATYNEFAFGTFGLMGGYAQSPVGFDNPVRPPLLTNFVGALFDDRRGLLVYSPFLVVLIPGIYSAFKEAPAWVRGAALGGGTYLAAQFVLNRFSGGAGFVGYRYPLEALVAAAPLLMLAYKHWVDGTRVRLVLFWLGVLVACAFQAVGVLSPGLIT